MRIAWMVAGFCALAGMARGADFAREVRPILQRSCAECHGAGRHKGGLRLDLRSAALKGGDSGPVIVAGHPEKSLLIERVTSTDPDAVMPAKGARLTGAEVDLLRRWIAEGAHWPDELAGREEETWWSLQPVRKVEAPKRQGWGINAVDAFVAERLAREGLSPSGEADRRTLIRRVSYDLTGLPPTFEEIEAFAADPDPGAYEKLVEKLLASPRYGERWGRHWLDVVRYADTHGFEMNQPRANAWPYRDYVIRSLNEDKPYDRFVREQISGDALGADEATGYLVAGAWDQVKSPDPVLTAQQRADELHDMVSVTGSAFLGLTVGCARCHDHKFDPITQLDYYRMTAVFAGVQHGEREWRSGGASDGESRERRLAEVRQEIARIDAELELAEPVARPGEKRALRDAVQASRNVERIEPAEARFVRFTIAATNNGAEPCIDELEIWAGGKNIGLASAGAKVRASGTLPGFAIHRLEHLNDGAYGNSRSWISDTPGRGWVEVELAGPATVDRIVWGRDREVRYLDRVPSDYHIEVALEPGQWTTVAGSNDRASKAGESGRNPARARLLGERAALETELQQLSGGMKIYAGVFAQPGATHRLGRGDPMQPREEVSPGGIAAVGTLELPASSSERDRRIALGRWLTDPANPLVARVIVNRLWHYHFGQGIVATPSDFGRMGAKPTHPELLDWLAGELVQRGWKLKEIHRLIVLSATYRQSGAARPEAMKRDAQTTLLWRFPPRRLEAEEVRDSVLLATGKLDLRMGGPGYDVFAPNDNYVRVYTPKLDFGPAEFRRMVYQFRPRLQAEPTFGVFDCPDGGQPAPRRTSSTTALQALNMLNSRFMMQQAQLLAERARREGGERTAMQVERAFELALGRRPRERERIEGTALAEKHGLVLLCRALFNANEFVRVD